MLQLRFQWKCRNLSECINVKKLQPFQYIISRGNRLGNEMFGGNYLGKQSAD